VADLFKLDDNDRKKDRHLRPQRRICAVLGTPFSGAIFGVEVLYVGSLLYEDLLPSIIAGITSYQIASLLGIRYEVFPMAAQMTTRGIWYARSIQNPTTSRAS